jgi:DNA-directed RNA polymerases I and III subunit RPAC1
VYGCLSDPSAQSTDRNTLVFKLNVLCTRRAHPRKPNITPNSVFPHATDDDLYENATVLTSHLKWEPQGEQSVVFQNNPPAPTNPNIVLMKLRPGQEVDMEMHAVKGVAKDHAKFSAVGTYVERTWHIYLLQLSSILATATYRLLPHIILNPEKPILPHLVDKFASCFAPGVIRVDPHTKEVSVDSQNVRRETMAREVLRHPEFEGCVQLARVRDHFICTCLFVIDIRLLMRLL